MAQPAELSDEDVFGAQPAPKELNDEEVFGRQEMPGPLGALTSGLRHGAQEMQQSAAVAAHQPIPQFQPEGPEAESPQLADIGHPVSQLLPKLLYGLASGAPVLAAGVVGGTAGTLYAGPAGGVAGGAVAAGVAAAAQAIGPKMAAELLKTPEDTDGAFERALKQAGQEGIFSGLGWAAFGTISPFKTMLKNNLFQAFAIQPAVAEAQVATQNIQAGHPVTEGMVEAYPGAVAGTLLPMLGTEGARLAAHGARRAFRGPEAAPGEPVEPSQPPSPIAPEALQDAQATIERYRPPERTPAWARLREDITGANREATEPEKASDYILGGERPQPSPALPDEARITNPVSGTPQEKVQQLVRLTEENRPLIKDLMNDIDARFGGRTESIDNVKAPENILSKATRPSVLAQKPWMGVEHVRDSYRFKSVLDTLTDLPDIVGMLRDRGIEVIKPDVAKQLHPGSWGWRISAFDLRMPNGQIVEYYAPVRELNAALEGGGHQYFENWRNEDPKKLTPDQILAYQKDLEASQKLYQGAWDAYLARTGEAESDLRASLNKAEAVARGTSPKEPLNVSSAVNAIPGSQRPPTRDAAQPSLRTSTSPAELTPTFSPIGPSKSYVSTKTPVGNIPREPFFRAAEPGAPPVSFRPEEPDAGHLLSVANKAASKWQDKLGPSIKVVVGGSLVSRTHVDAGQRPDLDVRFLTDNPERDYPKVEAATGLKLRKTRPVTDYPSGQSKGFLVEGPLTRDGVTFDVEAMVRKPTHVGWARFYSAVMTPDELSAYRADKMRLKGDKEAYKALKARMIAEVQRRVEARGGPAAVEAQPTATNSPGIAPHRVTAADGTAIDVAPRVVEASAIRTSQDQGYDPALQPRQRSRAASQAQVRDIATNLDPERLGYSAEADRGAPIVGPDGMVESGNGRVLALRNVYAKGGPQADAYRAWLAKQGVDVAAFSQPVLVRQRTTPLTPEARRAFTVAANQASTLAMSAPEKALADARLIDNRMLGFIRNPDDLGAAGNRDFIRRFVALLPQSEQGMIADARGALSAEGLMRIRNAILAKAYDDPGILARIAESTNDEVKSISNALTAAAPAWAKLRAAIAAGRVRADMDATPFLLEAVKRTVDLRSRGEKLDAYLAQQDAFNKMPKPVEDIMRMFYDPKERQAASAKRISDALKFYAEEADKVSVDAGLGLGLVPLAPADILQRAKEKHYESYRTELPDRHGARNVAGTETRGGQERGSFLSPPGEGTARPGDFGDQEAAERAQRPEGAMIRGYHGTKSAFDTFSLRGAGKSDPGLVGKAVYFTPSKEQASDYATSPHYGGRDEAQRVVSVAADLKNPLVIEDGRLPDGRSLSRDIHPNGIMRASAQAFQREIRKMGHDGVIFRVGGEDTQYAVFDPKQIRPHPFGEVRPHYTREQLERMDIDDLDRMAFGHVQGEALKLNPNEIKIKYKDDLENPKDKFKKEGMKWVRSVDLSEPIQVSIAQDGKFYLEDGHHRWFAAQKLGKPLAAEIQKIDGKPIEEILRRQERGEPLKAPKHPDVNEDEVKAERERKPTGWEATEPQDYGPRPGERVVPIGWQTVAHVSDKYTEAEQKIADAVHAIGKRMAPQAQVAGVKALRQGGEPIWGAFIDSPTFPHLIAWSLEKGGGGEHLNAYANTVRHEVIHHLKRAGLIRPEEWGALYDAAADGWLDKHRINERYFDLSTDQKIEEAIAEEFGTWRFDREVLKGIKDPIRRVIMQAFQRMDLFFKQVAAAARQFMGRNATANDVFTRIESGEVGQRRSEQIEARKAGVAAQKPRTVGSFGQKTQPPLGAQPDFTVPEALGKTAENHVAVSSQKLNDGVIEDFLKANDIGFRKETSRSLSDSHGPSASIYYHMETKNGVKTVRLSDHSYGPRTLDFRYGHDAAPAFEQILKATGHQVPADVSRDAAMSRISAIKAQIADLEAQYANPQIPSRKNIKFALEQHRALLRRETEAMNAQHRAHGGRIRAEKALPPDHELGMRVPEGGSKCGNCRFLASDTTCGNQRFVKWNGSATLPAPKDQYCCDLYEHHKARADGGRVVDGIKIDLTYDCPWMSELSRDGKMFYADRSLPRFIMNNGKRLEVIRPLIAHEVAEYAAMQQHRNEAPDKVYKEAHRNAGIPAERKYIEDGGWSWPAWEAWCRGKLASLEKKKAVRPPPHPDVRPVPHGRGDLEVVRARADGGRADDDLPVMVDPLAGKRSIGERPDVQQAVKDYATGLADPLARVGRIITGQSEEPFQDAARVALSAVGPPGAGRLAKGLAGYALSKGMRSLARDVEKPAIMPMRANGGRIMPHYVEHNPTEAQKLAGNYKMGHVTVHGLDISIENIKGSMRSGIDKNGKPWRCVLPYNYGYVRGTKGKDGDHVDVLLGPHRQSRKVFVIDQKDADTGRFDEHKTAIGWGSAAQVRQAYLKGFSDGRGHRRLGHMRELDIDQFRHWLSHGNTTAPIAKAHMSTP